MERLEKRRRLVGGEALDPERAGERDDGPLETGPIQRLHPKPRIVIGEAEAVFGLAVDSQHPLRTRPSDERRAAALGQGAEQTLGPEVLVDVGAAIAHWDHLTKLT